MKDETQPPPSPDAWHPFVWPTAARVWAAIVGAALLALLVARIVPGWAAWLDGIDHAWWDRMVANDEVAPLALARLLEFVGGAWVTVPLRVLVALLLLALGWRSRFRFWVWAMIPAELLNLLLKALYDRPRPPGQMSHTINAAFPSGHTTTAAAIAFGLVLVFVRPGRGRVVGWLLALGWTLLMAWSRTQLRDHWLTDVVAGAALGIVVVLVAALRTDPGRKTHGNG